MYEVNVDLTFNEFGFMEEFTVLLKVNSMVNENILFGGRILNKN